MQKFDVKKGICTLLIACSVCFAPSIAIAAAKKTAPKPKVVPVISCTIKGNISSPKKEKIYHLPGCASYKATIIETGAGERWFCSEKEAKDAGWRKALNCPR